MDENRFPLSGIEQIFIDLSSLDLAILSSDLFRLRRYSPPPKAVKTDYAVLSMYFNSSPDLAQMELWTVPFWFTPFLQCVISLYY